MSKSICLNQFRTKFVLSKNTRASLQVIEKNFPSLKRTAWRSNFLVRQASLKLFMEERLRYTAMGLRNESQTTKFLLIYWTITAMRFDAWRNSMDSLSEARERTPSKEYCVMLEQRAKGRIGTYLSV